MGRRLANAGGFFIMRTAILLAAVAAPGLVAGTLAVSIVDEMGLETPARVYLSDSQGRAHFAPGAIVYDRARGSIEERHFVPPGGRFRVELAAGWYSLEVERGKEYVPVRERVEVPAAGTIKRTLRLARWVQMSALGWYSADMHTHRPLRDTAALLASEDLNVMLPISRWRRTAPEVSEDPDLARILQEADEAGVIHAAADRWFTVVNEELEPRSSALLATKLGRRSTPLEFPMPDYARRVRAAGGLVDSEKATSLELPVIAAAGGVDVVGLANNHLWRSGVFSGAWGTWPERVMREYPRTAAGFALAGFELYYGLLNMGFPLKLSAGSASGVHPVPPGWSRVYVHVSGAFTPENWFRALREGRSFVTNGPMLFLKVNGREPGEEIAGQTGARVVEAEVRMLSRTPVKAAEVVVNGRAVAVRLASERGREASFRGTALLRLDGTSWIAARWLAEREGNCDLAHTAPVWYHVPGKPLPSPREQAAYFARRVEELMAGVEAGKEPGVAAESQAAKEATLARMREALAVYRAKMGQ
jgi:hypothetical protein